jgi:hypothetical protein
MLNGDDDSAAVTDFGLRGKCEVHPRCEGDDGRQWWLRWRLVFVMTERTGVEDTICAVVVLDCGISHVHCGFWSSCCQSFGVFVDVVEIVLGIVSCPFTLDGLSGTYVEFRVLSNLFR